MMENTSSNSFLKKKKNPCQLRPKKMQKHAKRILLSSCFRWMDHQKKHTFPLFIIVYFVSDGTHRSKISKTSNQLWPFIFSLASLQNRCVSCGVKSKWKSAQSAWIAAPCRAAKTVILMEKYTWFLLIWRFVMQLHFFTSIHSAFHNATIFLKEFCL